MHSAAIHDLQHASFFVSALLFWWALVRRRAGVFALALLVGFQFVVSRLSVRWRWVRKLATGEPQMLLYRGEFITSALRCSRVTEDEVLAPLRSAGVDDRRWVDTVGRARRAWARA